MKDEQQVRKVRTLVRSRDQVQDTRIKQGNRLTANFRAKLGIEEGEEADEKQNKILKELEKDYKRLTDGIAKITARRSYPFEGVIEDYIELRMVNQYFDLVDMENRLTRDIERALDGVQIWDEFLDDVKGVGPATGGVIVSELNPHKAPYPSSFWKYCGLHVINGEGASRKKEHLEEVEYVNSDGEKDTRKSLGYNPWVKTKLMGVLAPSFLKAKSEYRDHYDRYRNRIENEEEHEDKSDGHLHQMSLRYMVKQFLIELHMKWRYLEDLAVTKPYHEAKLGKNGHGLEEKLGIENPKRHDD